MLKFKLLATQIELFFYKVSMGKIKNESLKYIIISYCGYLIGIFSTIFLFSTELKFYGTIRYIFATSLLLSSFFTLGLNASIIKYYNYLKNEKLVNSFISFSLVGIVFFSLVIYLILTVYKDLFVPYNTGSFWNLKNYIFPIICLYSINSLLFSFLANYYITAIPNIFDSFLPKIYTIISFFFFVYTKNVEKGVILFIIISLISTSLLFFYMKKKTDFKLSFDVAFLKEICLKKEILKFSGYSLFNSFLYATISQIGMVVLGETGNLTTNGIYGIISSIIGLVSIPLLGLSKSSVPLISEYIDNGNISDLKQFYKKSSLYLFFLGSFLFLIICTNFDALFIMLNKGELVGHFKIILIIGVAFLIDLLTGINSNIINRSDRYRYNTLFIGFTALISFFASYYLIIMLRTGLLGVAISTFISLLVFNTLKLIFNFVHFNLLPFSKEMVPISILIFIFLIFNRVLIVEQFNFPLLYIMINSIVILLSFIFVNYYFKIIELNSIVGFKN